MTKVFHFYPMFFYGFISFLNFIEGGFIFPSEQRLTMDWSATTATKLHMQSTENPIDSFHMEKSKVSIAIIGSGAVGCYYGARLWETGQYNVKFLMRGEHFLVSKKKGLNVKSIEGDIFIPPNELQAYENIEDIGKVDWVILCLKNTGIKATQYLLPPLLTKKSRVLAIMNGMVDYDIVSLLENQSLDKIEPNEMQLVSPPKLTLCAATYGGMALLCSNRIGPGHIEHSYAGKLTASLVTSSSDDSQIIASHKEAMEELWRPTRCFEFCYDDNIVRARWTKNLWNLPFNGISVAMDGITIDRVVKDEGLRRLAYNVMDETIAVANKDLMVRGYSKDYFLGQVEKDQMMTLSDNMGAYHTSTMLDFVNRKPMEVYYLFRKALERANQLSVPVPTLDTLVTQIEAKQRYYNLF